MKMGGWRTGLTRMTLRETAARNMQMLLRDKSPSRLLRGIPIRDARNIKHSNLNLRIQDYHSCERSNKGSTPNAHFRMCNTYSARLWKESSILIRS